MGADLVIRGAACVVTCEDGLGVLPGSAVACEGGRISWIGADADAPDADEIVDARGCLVLPGLVDCHTHIVWAGERSGEFERRLTGVPYTTILEEGGGILSTVRATRAAAEDDLVALATARLRYALSRGVTTVEVKSGYGLEAAAEARILRAARAAGEAAGVTVTTTFLGAHAIPAEWRHDRAEYVRRVIEEQIPAVAGLATAIDVYVDRGAFTLEEGRAILAAGKAAGLHVRAHSEQVGFTGIAAAAAELGALAVDHVEHIDDAGIAAVARSGAVAVLLPGAMLYLRDPSPPVAKMRAAGIPLAVATDYNPGSSPVADPWACGTLAAITMGLTVEEVILGLTRNAARAIGRPDLGRIAVGLPADLAVMRPPPGFPVTPAGLVQPLGGPVAHAVIRGGRRAILGR